MSGNAGRLQACTAAAAVAAIATVAAMVLAPRQLGAQTQPREATLEKLPWRSIGPANQAGRVSVIVGVPGEPFTFYVSGANGGVFRTRDGGVSYDTLFDDKSVLSIGAIAIAPSDPNIVYVGTGEGNPRNNASFGNGVYRSDDGGDHFIHVGLEGTDKIPRIVIDDQNPRIAYVCALGREWGPNEDRGVFRTNDGGSTWKKVLYLDQLTGCSDIRVDPTNSQVVYAGMYTYLRQPWHLSSGGGRTGVYKSVDGGEHWVKLTRGLPKGDMDRIGIAVARSNPSTVYVISETRNEGELWRSDDAGESWRVVNRDPNINFRPFYYADIRVDPSNPDRIFALSGSLYLSEDGGRNFRRIGRDVHGDHQALWIDPSNPKRVLSGSDGGFQISRDGGKNFEVINNIAFTQFYHIDFDMRTPYWLCGGLQDNGHWCGPSRTALDEGIRKRDWFTISGGDGFFAVPDVARPWLVYSASQGGNLVLTDTRTGDERSIHPYPNRVGSAGDAMADHKYRFNWNSPIALSPQNPGTVYFGGNVLFKSTNHGQSWEVISPDLTDNDKSKQGNSGGPVVVDNTAAEFYNTLLTIAPSPLDSNVIWVGTDDGHIQVTRDGGKQWSDVGKNIQGLAPHAWIPTVDASHHDAGTAYVAADHHRDDDYSPYIYRTTDFGKSWTKLTTGLPKVGWVHVVREDPRNKSLLYAGTEVGPYASWDGGAHWQSIAGGLPPAPVRDIKVHPRDNDLIIATHGRGAYIYDDATPLQALPSALAAQRYLFDIRPAVRWVMWGNDGNLGQGDYSAKNPPYGALINYYFAEAPKSDVTVTITDPAGKVVRKIEKASKKVGLNQVAWDLRDAGPWQPDTSARRADRAKRDTTPAAGPAAVPPGPVKIDSTRISVQGGAARGGEAEGGDDEERRFFGSRGSLVMPGTYTVTLVADGQRMSKSVEVRMDPRVEINDADLKAQLVATASMDSLASRANHLLYRTNDLLHQLDALSTQLKRASSPNLAGGPDGNGKAAADSASSPVQKQVRATIEKLEKFRDDELTRPIRGLGYRQYPRLVEEVQRLSRMISGTVNRPTDPALLRMHELQTETNQAESTLNSIISTDIDAINRAMDDDPRIMTANRIVM